MEVGTGPDPNLYSIGFTLVLEPREYTGLLLNLYHIRRQVPYADEF